MNPNAVLERAEHIAAADPAAILDMPSSLEEAEDFMLALVNGADAWDNIARVAAQNKTHLDVALGRMLIHVDKADLWRESHYPSFPMWCEGTLGTKWDTAMVSRYRGFARDVSLGLPVRSVGEWREIAKAGPTLAAKMEVYEKAALRADADGRDHPNGADHRKVINEMRGKQSLMSDPKRRHGNDHPGAEAVPTDALRPSPWRIKSDPDQNVLRTLAHDGFIAHPIIAQPDGTIIHGNLRWEAAKELGWGAVPVIRMELAEDEAKKFLIGANKQDDAGLDAIATEWMQNIEDEFTDMAAIYGPDETHKLLTKLAGSFGYEVKPTS